VLELGGSDPFIVLSSADLTRAMDAAVAARVINNGQSCIAAKRFIVVDESYERFLDGMIARMSALRMGDPNLESTELGPLATPAIRDEVAQQVDALLAAGAKLRLGGRIPEGAGNFYPATVIDSVSMAVPAARQEIFGPVALIFRARDAAHALELANDSEFGLGASVWTRDRDEARSLARELQVGSVFVNAIVASDPRFPFGGIKRSGYGRELGGYGLREFVNVKTVRCNFYE
jgi:succinate-semialdehyde dehydrogenase/glutarate-semialdehyde dehydrogenase